MGVLAPAGATLAQPGPLSLPDPPALPAPGWVDHWVLESPWMLAAGCVLAGVVVWRAGLLGRRSWLGVVVGVVLGAGAVVLGVVVSTPRERMVESARRLVRAVATGHAPGVDAELGGDARLRAWYFPGPLPRERILEEVSGLFGAGPFRLEDWGILELDACRDGPNVGRAQVKVRVVPASTGTPHLSWWKLDYRLEDDGVWRVRGIEPLAVLWVPDPRGSD